MARRPNTAGITQIGEFLVNKALPIAPRPPTSKPPTRVRSGGNEGYIIGPTDMVYKYSDLPKLKEQVAANPALAAMLGDIISRLEAKDFDGTGDPLGNRQMERPATKQQSLADAIGQHITSSSNPEYIKKFDTNQDGKLSVEDVIFAQQFDAGLRDPNTLQIIEERPPSIEQEIEKVISGPSFPGRQTPKARDLPVRTPEPVGPITDTRTMPSMPVAPVPSPVSVPPIAIEEPDIQRAVDALPKGTRQPVQPPVTVSPPTPSVFDPGPSAGTEGGTGYGKYPLGTAGPKYVYDDEGNPIMEPPVFDVAPPIPAPPLPINPPQREVKLPDGTVIDIRDIIPQPEEERIPVDPTDPNDPLYGIFPGEEPKDLFERIFKDEAGLKDKYPLPEGVDPGGRYYTDPITGDPMYQPPMPTAAPGEIQLQVMPTPINLMTGKPRRQIIIPSEPTEPTEPAVPAPEVIPPVSPPAPVDPTNPYFPSTPGNSCPSPEEHIQLANNDWILAGELKVGDEVITSEEPQKVTYAKRIEDSPRREVLFTEGDSIVTSPSHPYFVNSKGFVDVEDLKEGDEIGSLIVSEVKPFSDGPVIHISVDKAQTYMLRGGTEENPVPALSHNKLPPMPVLPPDTPVTPTTPTPTPEVVSPAPDTGTEGSVMEQMQKMIDELRAEQVAQQQQYQQSIADMKAQQESQQQQKMDFYQQMLADSQAQQQQRQEQEASMVPQYTMPVGPYGYNPYQSGQYQSDPYGPAGVPQMGGITTIPVPGGYGIYNPVYGG